MSLRHLVLFRFVDHVSDEQVAALADGLDALPAKIAQIRSYRHGRDAGISAASWDYAVMAEFDSPADFQAYRDHPDHVAVVRNLVEPVVAERASVQLPA